MIVYRSLQVALTLLLISSAQLVFAAMPPSMRGTPEATGTNPVLSSRINCANALSPIDQDINNVRARLLTGGDVWWNGRDGRYVVPKVPAGELEVSSIYAAAVWLGGFDPAGSLKLAAQQYGRSQGRFDYYPGPLDPETGEITRQECSNWDKFFVVNASEIREHQRLFAASLRGEIQYTEDLIPEGVKGWPARGNPYFEEVHGFAPPNTNQGLAGFYDYCDSDGNCNLDGLYDPLSGDLPVIEIEGCEDYYNPDEDLRDAPQFPDQMIFWIYNDNGNVHQNSNAEIPLQMEVQVQAFSYSTNDALNNMTFQRYKLINRGKDLLRDTYFGIWVDGDLGCSNDDYIGCDTTRSLAYYYNADPVDGDVGAACGGVNTYGEDPPLVGIDYFRGPKEFIEVPNPDSLEPGAPATIEIERELGMSSFTYFIRPDQAPNAGMSDPVLAGEYYNLLSGLWKDGTPYTAEDQGYQTAGAVSKYVFPDAPSLGGSTVWSMCSEALQEADRRTIQASGPFNLRPGAVNELIIGVPWVPEELTYPCPDLGRLLDADDLAQNLFDACFDITDGPDAPDVDLIELDRQLTLVLSNDENASNNAFLRYAELDLLAPDGASDSLYRFEGYKVYQLRDANVSVADLDDPTQARLIAQSDLKNGVTELYNWRTIPNPLDPSTPVYEPVPQVNSGNTDQGVSSVIRVTIDQFASGQDTRLINHKPYYFTAVAYAYNSYGDFDPNTASGQPLPYLEGRNNIVTYTGVPRTITDIRLGESNKAAQVTRLDGVGTGPFFLDLAEGERDRILESPDTMPVYQEGRSPVEARTYNPFDVKDGTYRIEFVDSDLTDDVLDEDGTWRMIDENGEVILADQSYAVLNEQIVGELGISVNLGQVSEAGANEDDANGCIGYEQVVSSGTNWLTGIASKTPVPILGTEIFNFVKNTFAEENQIGNSFDLDPNSGLADCFDGQWYPLGIVSWQNETSPIGVVTPHLVNRGNRLRDRLELEDLNNVDIVFTSDKSKWSRCVVVETATDPFLAAAGLETEGNRSQFELRASPSVGKEDDDGDGLPDTDGDGEGMGWFPGYAVDVETGQRLNIFFGENSAIHYDPANFLNPYNFYIDAEGNEPFPLTGRDMMFNPTSVDFSIQPGAVTPALYFAIAGGHHFIYVTREPYDECARIRELLEGGSSIDLRDALELVTYTSIPLSTQDFQSYSEGLIPAETVCKLRVQNPYNVAQPFDIDDRTGDAPTGANSGHPAYELVFTGVTPTDVPLSQGDSILSFINVVPNPYYGYSEYEINEFSNLIRITNLPPRANITIYTLDGKFIRQYRRAEELPGVDFVPEDPRLNNRAIQSRQIYPDLDWDMKNEQGIPVSSGVYLVHVDAFELGQRTLKAFILQRAFDPAGL